MKDNFDEVWLYDGFSDTPIKSKNKIIVINSNDYPIAFDSETLENVVLPLIDYKTFIKENCVFDYELQEYILK